MSKLKRNCLSFLKDISNPIFEKDILIFYQQHCVKLLENYFFIPVEFFERKNKLPVPEHKVTFIFKINRTLKKAPNIICIV